MAKRQIVVDYDEETGQLLGDPYFQEEPLPSEEASVANRSNLTNPGLLADEQPPGRIEDPLSNAGYIQEKLFTDPLAAYSRFITGPQKVGPLLWLGGSPVPLPPPSNDARNYLMLSAFGDFYNRLRDARRAKSNALGTQETP